MSCPRVWTQIDTTNARVSEALKGRMGLWLRVRFLICLCDGRQVTRSGGKKSSFPSGQTGSSHWGFCPSVLFLGYPEEIPCPCPTPLFTLGTLQLACVHACMHVHKFLIGCCVDAAHEILLSLLRPTVVPKCQELGLKAQVV